MRTAGFRWLAAALAGSMAAAPGMAQEALEAGRLAEGTVAGASEPASVPLRLSPGQSVQLDALPGAGAAAGVDLTLKAFAPDGGLVAEDDDGGGALNPRLEVGSEAGGLYRVEVGTVGGGGAFTLLARTSPYRAQAPVELSLAGGPAERGIEFPADTRALYTFAGRRGEVLLITLAPEEGGEPASDPFLELFQGDRAIGTALAQDDDSLGGLGARIVAEIPEDGPYTVRVSSLSNAGRATLGIARMAMRQATLETLSLDGAAAARLGEQSPFITDHTERRLWPYALYRLPDGTSPARLAASGQVIVLTAESEALDPYIELGFDTPFGFTAVATNDD
ncbi:MAG TPA: hypothetical protein VEB68_08365, partial [Croceibacterium sp.]|nr:hypothetical protein [Croceibacterium sp.]